MDEDVVAAPDEGRKPVPGAPLTLWATAAGATLTALSIFTPLVPRAYRNPQAHVALESIEAIIALGTAYLVIGRLRSRSSHRDALLAYALLVFGLTNIVLSVIPQASLDSRATELSWAALASRVAATLALATGVLGHGRFRSSRHVTAAVVAGALLTVIISGMVVSIIDPPPLVIAESGAAGGEPRLVGSLAFSIGQMTLVALFAAASIGYTLIGRRMGDEMLRWIGAGTSLAAAARLNYIAFPSIYSDIVYTGDALRLGFYLFLLAGASSELRTYWRTLEMQAEERERLIDRLRTLSLEDELTGLKNRRALLMLADQQMNLHRRTDQPLWLAFLDLNGMKTINDTYGHEAGDAALKEFSTLLRESFRSSDVVARLGGDEFCVMIPDENPQPSVDRLRQRLAVRPATRSAPYEISVSIGLTRFDPATHATVEDLLEDADRAMYADKAGGGR